MVNGHGSCVELSKIASNDSSFQRDWSLVSTVR